MNDDQCNLLAEKLDKIVDAMVTLEEQAQEICHELAFIGNTLASKLQARCEDDEDN